MGKDTFELNALFPDFGSEDCRFESCYDHSHTLIMSVLKCARYYLQTGKIEILWPNLDWKEIWVETAVLQTNIRETLSLLTIDYYLRRPDAIG